jgi:HEAT repeat protein
MTAVEQLVRTLEDRDAGLEARAAAARALGASGDRSAVEPLLATLPDESIMATDVQTEIVMALGSLGDAAAVDALRATLYDPEERYSEFTTQQEAIHALADIGATGTLREISEDPGVSEYFRELARDVLARWEADRRSTWD